MINIYPRVWVEVDLKNIEHNVRTLKDLCAPDVLFMAIVKANGYGHGSSEVANAALKTGADRLGVATVDEAKVLRDAGIMAPIHLLTGFQKNQVDSIIDMDLIPAIYTDQHMDALETINSPLKVHVKIDTGMGRLGLKPKDASSFIKRAMENKELEIEGVFTHLATADEEASEYTDKQIREFKKILEDLKEEGIDSKINHIANSAATILRPDSHLQMVRVGIALYGLHPSHDTKSKVDIRPALSWYSRLSYIKELEAGKSVSYGATHTLKNARAVGTVPVGYADGYSRTLSNNAQVMINGKKVDEIGRVCMDQFMIDLGSISAKEGDKVTLLGSQNGVSITADDLADKLNTINYEIVCSISSRVKRYYRSL